MSRWWFSGRILACHAGDRGSIPRLKNLAKNCYHHLHGQRLESLQHMSKEEHDHQFMLPKIYTERFFYTIIFNK